MNWDEVRQMQDAGMVFGSHAHSHEILSGLTSEQQDFELCESRSILEREVRSPVDVLSYPVGLPYTFKGRTMDAVKRAGFTAAFSFYGGLNDAANSDLLDIRRCTFSSASHNHYRLSAISRSLLNRDF